MGDFNANINNPTSLRTQQLTNLLATFGLEDLLPHFKQCSKHQGLHTWTQTRLGTCYRSRCDYIFGTDRHLFRSIRIKDPRHFTSDHFMLVGQY